VPVLRHDPRWKEMEICLLFPISQLDSRAIATDYMEQMGMDRLGWFLEVRPAKWSSYQPSCTALAPISCSLRCRKNRPFSVWYGQETGSRYIIGSIDVGSPYPFHTMARAVGSFVTVIKNSANWPSSGE